MRRVVAAAHSPGIVRQFYQNSADRWILVIEKSSIYVWSETRDADNSGRQLQRRPSSTPESSDIETIQNLIESSHLQLKSLQEKSSPESPSSEILATCQLNVRYLEEVKAGLVKPQNGRLNDQLVQMDELIKFWQNLETDLSQSHPRRADRAAMDSARNSRSDIEGRSDRECSGEKPRPVGDNDTTQPVRLRPRRVWVEQDRLPRLHTSDEPMFKSQESVIHEFQRVHCQWQDVSNQLINIERVLTDCESLLRNLENELSNVLSEEGRTSVHDSIQGQLDNLEHMDDLFTNIASLSHQIAPALNASNQQWLEERLKRIKNRKQLLRQWCSDLISSLTALNSSDRQGFSCGACALESNIGDKVSASNCSTIQQRRLHYIRKFWRNAEEGTVEEPVKVEYSAVETGAANQEPRSNKGIQCNSEIKLSSPRRNWRLMLFVCLILVAIVYFLTRVLARDCSRIYYSGWLHDFLHPVYIPIC